jgi:hypothetical protein
VIAGLASGALRGPIRFRESATFFVLRISGTGVAYRDKLDEFSFRPREVWATPEMAARWTGIPITVLHPEGNGLIDGAAPCEIVGSCVEPFVRDNELWCVARIWNAHVADCLAEFGGDTSPSVEVGATERVLIDGETVLKEVGPPKLCDSLALCPLGVWSKSSTTPSGVADERVSNNGSDRGTTETTGGEVNE